MKNVLYFVVILCAASMAEIRYNSIKMRRDMILDIDTDGVTNQSEYDDVSGYEFGLFGHGILWMKPDGRTYSIKCCDGTLEAQGIGSIHRTTNYLLQENRDLILQEDNSKIKL